MARKFGVIFAKSTATDYRDFNHPLAGHTSFTFDIEVLEIDPARECINMQILLANPRGFCAG